MGEIDWFCPPCEVLIVVPPFATAKYPSLGPSLVAAACRRAGIRCQILYVNLWLAARLGLELYEEIASSSVYEMRGERPFAAWAFSDQVERAEEPEVSDALVREMTEMVVDQVRRSGARIVGFSSVFQQNLASIALSRRLKAADASLITVLGGSNADMPMGAELAKLAGGFDHIFSGESEAHFPEFCRQLLQNGEHPSEKVIRCPPIQDLDSGPLLDYDDYFSYLQALQTRGLLPDDLPVSLPFESSRGCWWGERQHCTFCGLNGTTMAFRRKSSGRIVSEILGLSGRYGVRRLHATDNIMPPDFREGVLTKLTQAHLELFYEVKSNLKPEDLDLFATAGVVSIQPGIESLSSSILKKIRKGVSGTQNLWLLRECAARQINVNWNMLVSIPGDEAGDYESMLQIIPLVQHLEPPSGCTSILIDRYSPYHNDPARFEIRDLKPLGIYSKIYPAGTDLSQLAYHFSGAYPSGFIEAPGLAARFEEQVNHWITSWHSPAGPRPTLVLVRLDSGRFLVFDSRDVAVEHQYVLGEAEAEVVRYYEVPRRSGSLPDQLREAERELLDRGFLLSYEGLVLSLLVEPEKGFRLRAADAAPAI